MIYIHFVVQHTLMLHITCKGNWPCGSGEDVFKVLSIFENGDHLGLGHVT